MDGKPKTDPHGAGKHLDHVAIFLFGTLGISDVEVGHLG